MPATTPTTLNRAKVALPSAAAALAEAANPSFSSRVALSAAAVAAVASSSSSSNRQAGRAVSSSSSSLAGTAAAEPSSGGVSRTEWSVLSHVYSLLLAPVCVRWASQEPLLQLGCV